MLFVGIIFQIRGFSCEEDVQIKTTSFHPRSCILSISAIWTTDTTRSLHYTQHQSIKLNFSVTTKLNFTVGSLQCNKYIMHYVLNAVHIIYGINLRENACILLYEGLGLCVLCIRCVFMLSYKLLMWHINRNFEDLKIVKSRSHLRKILFHCAWQECGLYIYIYILAASTIGKYIIIIIPIHFQVCSSMYIVNLTIWE